MPLTLNASRLLLLSLLAAGLPAACNRVPSDADLARRAVVTRETFKVRGQTFTLEKTFHPDLPNSSSFKDIWIVTMPDGSRKACSSATMHSCFEEINRYLASLRTRISPATGGPPVETATALEKLTGKIFEGGD